MESDEETVEIHIDGAIAAAWLLDIVDSVEYLLFLRLGGQNSSIEVISMFHLEWERE